MSRAGVIAGLILRVIAWIEWHCRPMPTGPRYSKDDLWMGPRLGLPIEPLALSEEEIQREIADDEALR